MRAAGRTTRSTEEPVTAKEWDALRYGGGTHTALTNVWQLAPLHGVERIKGTMRRAAPRVYNPSSLSAAHLNQKPLEFMRRILNAVTDPGDVVGAVRRAGVSLGRRRGNRPVPVRRRDRPRFAEIAAQRLDDALAGRDPEAEDTTA